MSLAPQLKKIKVDPNKLYLDPNNPRLFEKETEKVPLDKVTEPGVQSSTEESVANIKDKFGIKELVKAIQINGYLPEAGGFMFVRKISEDGNYLVLEGNRRLTAIRKIFSEKEKNLADFPDSMQTLSKIEVMEIVDDIPEEMLQKKISYLLGTAHHGGNKNWSPFAQANEIFKTYLEVSAQNKDTFKYDEEYGQKVASLLNTKTSEVKERLAVYRSMRQLAETDEMKAQHKGGIIDDYYSLVKEAVCSGKQAIKEYIKFHPDNFILEDAAVERMINLCQFNGKGGRGRPGPMNNPKQWGWLSKILDDPDPEKVTEMLERVEVNHERPEEVYAERAAELRRMDWKTWLRQVRLILKDVPMGDNLDSVDAYDVMKKIKAIISELGNTEENQNA